jgi:hypothetical protein
MLITIQTGRTEWLRDRSRFYHMVRFVGRTRLLPLGSLCDQQSEQLVDGVSHRREFRTQ